MSCLKTELTLKNSLKFMKSCYINDSSPPTQTIPIKNQDSNILKESDDCFGGIIKKGQLGWIARGPLFEVFSLKNGHKVSSFRFDLYLGFERCIVTCVAEVDIPKLNLCVLAICIQFGDVPGGIIVLCSVQEFSKVFRCIEIKEKVTCCHYIGKEISKRTILQIFDGCLAVGTDSGKIILLDLKLNICQEALFSGETDEEDIQLIPCYIIENSSDLHHLSQQYHHCKKDNVHFGIQLNIIEDSALVLSIISVVNILSLIAGLEDGRLIIFDLSEFQILYTINSPSKNKLLPLVKLGYVEPADDPRACIYIWAFHEGDEPATALMYSIMYEKRILEDDGIYLFEGLQTYSLRLRLNLSKVGGVPIACQSVFKQSHLEEGAAISLCLLAWKEKTSTNLVIFDMNQWYKEQMPSYGSLFENETYLATYSINDCNALEVYLDQNSIATFNSIKRLEEHFYPTSLSFDCIALHHNGCSHLHWPGLQHRALEFLKSGGALAILEPALHFNEIMKASLLPQYCEKSQSFYRQFSTQSRYLDDAMDTSVFLENYNSTFSINDQRNILLSIALEYNCFGLLKDCALCWADGSCLGRQPSNGLSLSTMTEWIWNRANIIKKHCNRLCEPLFNRSGIKIDQRSKTTLSYLLRQLKSLGDLIEIILKKCIEYIPSDVYETLSTQHKSIRMSSEYQEIVQWLLNIGLLPEGPSDERFNSKQSLSQSNFIPYPYKILKDYYSSRRKQLGQLNKSSICSRSGSCRILYIDAFIEHECNATLLRDNWVDCGGDELYPPSSLQALLRIMLIPGISIENKYTLLIYLFLDLNTAIESKNYSDVVHNLIKFPAVFKLNAPLIKNIQAFWNLDHEQFEVALEELISPFSKIRKFGQWEKELLIEALLTQNQPSLSLRALQISSTPISSLLELKTLLSNDLVAEAFHLQRTKNDPELFRQFLTGCLYLGKLGVLRDLAFTEEESKILEEFLKQAQSSKTKNLYFAYLLQKSEYVEAMSYLDELSQNKQHLGRIGITDLETPNLVLSAFNSTMTPALKELINVYCEIRNKIRPKDLNTVNPSPLSSQLLQNSADKIIGGIYHSSILGTDQISVYWDEDTYKQNNRLLDVSNVPFIRYPQIDFIPEIGGAITSVSYPEIYKCLQKRKLSDSTDRSFDTSENPQKRRKTNECSRSLSQNMINTSLLTKFKNKSKMEDYDSIEKLQENKSFSQNSVNNKTVSNTLYTPIVKSISMDSKLGCDSLDERTLTPQSILKGKGRSCYTPAKRIFAKRRINIDSAVDNESQDEEKSIRFDLPDSRSNSPLSHPEEPRPISVSSSKSEMDNADVMELDEVNNDDEYQLPEQIEGYSGPHKRKPLERFNVLSMSSESENYYSPCSSKNVSKISERDIGVVSIEDTDTSFRSGTLKSNENQQNLSITNTQKEKCEKYSGSDNIYSLVQLSAQKSEKFKRTYKSISTDLSKNMTVLKRKISSNAEDSVLIEKTDIMFESKGCSSTNFGSSTPFVCDQKRTSERLKSIDIDNYSNNFTYKISSDYSPNIEKSALVYEKHSRDSSTSDATTISGSEDDIIFKEFTPSNEEDSSMSENCENVLKDVEYKELFSNQITKSEEKKNLETNDIVTISSTSSSSISYDSNSEASSEVSEKMEIEEINSCDSDTNNVDTKDFSKDPDCSKSSSSDGSKNNIVELLMTKEDELITSEKILMLQKQNEKLENNVLKENSAIEIPPLVDAENIVICETSEVSGQNSEFKEIKDINYVDKNSEKSSTDKENSLKSSDYFISTVQKNKDVESVTSINYIEQNETSELENDQITIEKVNENEMAKKKIFSRGQRAKSESIDINKKVEIYSPKISNRETRARSETQSKILTRKQSAILSRIEEDSISQPSLRSSITPTRILTRRLSNLLEQEENSLDLQSSSKASSPSTSSRILTRRRSSQLDQEQNSLVFQSSSRPTTPSTPSRILTRRQSAVLSIEESSLQSSSRKLDMEDLEQTPSKRTRRYSKEYTPRSVRGKSVLTEDNSQTPKQKNGTEKKTVNTPITNELEDIAKKVKSKKVNSSEFNKEETSFKKMKEKSEVDIKKSQKNVKKRLIKPSSSKYVSESDSDEEEQTPRESSSKSKLIEKKVLKSVKPSTSIQFDEYDYGEEDQTKKTSLKKSKSVEKILSKSTKSKNKQSSKRDEEQVKSRKEKSKSPSRTNKKDKSAAVLTNTQDSEEDLEVEDDYEKSRKMTRSQQEAYIKLKKVKGKLSFNSRTTSIDQSDREYSVEKAASVSSQHSKTSVKSEGPRRRTRSSTKSENDEFSSIESFTSTKSTTKSEKTKRSKKLALMPIEEEEDKIEVENEDSSIVSKRGRPKKAK